MSDYTQRVTTVFDAQVTAAYERAQKSLGVNVVEQKKLEQQMERTQGEIRGAARSMQDFGDKGVKATKEIQQSAGGMGKSLGDAGKLVAAYFAVDTLIHYGKEIVNITAEYQKMAAVLTNSLGSKSAARTALLNIQEIAAKTPYSVREWTESFVQLANRGITPSTKTLMAMGDLAGALGKPLEQVNQAVLDVSNSERWTELGIKVKTSGDKIIGTFRGITIEAEKTEQGALKMVQAFGEMEGVAGGMADVSQTLGGAISNAGDNFERLFNTLGNQGSGVMMSTIGLVNQLTEAIIYLVTSEEDLAKSRVASAKTRLLEGWEYKAVDDYKIHLAMLNEEMNKATVAQDEAIWKYSKLEGKYSTAEQLLMKVKGTLSAHNKEVETAAGVVNLWGDELTAIQEAIDEVQLKYSKFLATPPPIEKEKGKLEKLREELQAVTKLREQATSNAEITAHHKRMQLLQDEIRKLEELGKRKTDPVDNAKAIDLINQYSTKVDENRKTEVEKDQEAREKRLRDKKAELDEIARIEKRNADAVAEYQKRVKEEATAFAIMAVSLYMDHRRQQTEMEMQELEYEKNRSIELAGDNFKARAQIEAQYAEKQKQLRIKAAQQEKVAALFSIGVNTAQAVTSVLSTGGGTKFADFGISAGILTALVIAQGLAQAAAVMAKPIPKYAKGTRNVTGGVQGQDSVLAMLMPGEGVMPTHTNKAYGKTLDAVYTGAVPADYLNQVTDQYLSGKFRGFDLPKLPENFNIGGNQFDPHVIGKTVRDYLNDVKIINQVQDKDGFHEYEETQRHRLEWLNKRNKYTF